MLFDYGRGGASNRIARFARPRATKLFKRLVQDSQTTSKLHTLVCCLRSLSAAVAVLRRPTRRRAPLASSSSDSCTHSAAQARRWQPGHSKDVPLRRRSRSTRRVRVCAWSGAPTAPSSPCVGMTSAISPRKATNSPPRAREGSTIELTDWVRQPRRAPVQPAVAALVDPARVLDPHE